MRTHWIARSITFIAAIAALGAISCGGGGGSSPTAPAPNTKPQPGHVYIWAGTGSAGYGDTGQVPSKTQLYWPQNVIFAPDGTPFVVDWNNHRVLAVNSNGRFKLIVGVADGDFGDPCTDANGNPIPGCQNIVATNAKLNHPTQVAFDPANGDMILCAWHNSEVFRVHLATNLMDRICGDGSRGYNGDEQPASSAITDLPVSAKFDPQGRLVFADQANQVIRMIDENGVIHTIAGTPPIYDDATHTWQKQPGYDGDGGPALACHLHFEVGQIADPSGRIAYDGQGNLYIADSQNYIIRKVDTNGIITCVAGTPLASGYSGDGGPAVDAKLYEPRDLCFDADGNMYIADTGNHVIREVDTNGIISTVVGEYRAGGPDIPPLTQQQVLGENGMAAAKIHLTAPYGVNVGPKGNLWISDTGNHVIRILYR